MFLRQNALSFKMHVEMVKPMLMVPADLAAPVSIPAVRLIINVRLTKVTATLIKIV